MMSKRIEPSDAFVTQEVFALQQTEQPSPEGVGISPSPERDINIYNIQIERFPEGILAGLPSYRRKEFLEVPEEKKEDVDLEFS